MIRRGLPRVVGMTRIMVTIAMAALLVAAEEGGRLAGLGLPTEEGGGKGQIRESAGSVGEKELQQEQPQPQQPQRQSVHSLGGVHSVLTSSLHGEFDGDEDTFSRALEWEWSAFDRLSAGNPGHRTPFLVYSVGGRAAARRLREIAGGLHNVRSLHHDHEAGRLCSVASLDAAAVSTLLEEGDDQGLDFSLHPLPQLAKLSPQLQMVVEEGSSIGGGSEGGEGLPVLADWNKTHALEVILTPGEWAKGAVASVVDSWMKQLMGQRGGATGGAVKQLQESFFWLGAPAGDEGGVGAGATGESDHVVRKRGAWAGLLEHHRQGGGEEEEEEGAEGEESPLCGFSTPGGVAVSLPSSAVHLGEAKVVLTLRAEESLPCMSLLLGLLSVQPDVRRIGIHARDARVQNVDAAWVAQSNLEDYYPLWEADLKGEGEVIGVADTGVDRQHCHFRESTGEAVEGSGVDNPITDLTRRKVVQYIAYVDDVDTDNGHGTHVAGTLAGSVAGQVAGEGSADGQAYDAKIAVFDFGDSETDLRVPPNLANDMFAAAYDGAGARVHSNSWAIMETDYQTADVEIDTYVNENPQFLVVVAAGNCGFIDENDRSSTCSDIGPTRSVLSPALGKNVLAVGATKAGNARQTVAFFSSQGPTADNRIKPDVLTVGSPLLSASADPTVASCSFTERDGTSMACPVVAGYAAITRQYYREGWYAAGQQDLAFGFNPSAALLKATIVNSASSVGTAECYPLDETCSDVTLGNAPDMYQGFGTMTMSEALNFDQNMGIFIKDWEFITDGAQSEWNVTLTNSTIGNNLRVTLAWTDPPGAVGQTRAVLHNIDLQVVDSETGEVFYPNGGVSLDLNNNVEKVVVDNPVAGRTYLIRVLCLPNNLVESDTQTFAVVANGEFFVINQRPAEPRKDNLDKVSELLTTQQWIYVGVGAAVVLILGCLSCARSQSKRRNRASSNAHGRYAIRLPGASGRSTMTRTFQPQDTCPHCRRCFPSAAALVQHVTTHHPEAVASRSVSPGGTRGGSRPGGEVCPHCRARFSDVTQLVAHVQQAHQHLAQDRMASNRGGVSDDEMMKLAFAISIEDSGGGNRASASRSNSPPRIMPDKSGNRQQQQQQAKPMSDSDTEYTRSPPVYESSPPAPTRGRKGAPTPVITTVRPPGRGHPSAMDLPRSAGHSNSPSAVTGTRR